MGWVGEESNVPFRIRRLATQDHNHRRGSARVDYSVHSQLGPVCIYCQNDFGCVADDSERRERSRGKNIKQRRWKENGQLTPLAGEVHAFIALATAVVMAGADLTTLVMATTVSIGNIGLSINIGNGININIRNSISISISNSVVHGCRNGHQKEEGEEEAKIELHGYSGWDSLDWFGKRGSLNKDGLVEKVAEDG